jgi:hypothetical protein
MVTSIGLTMTQAAALVAVVPGSGPGGKVSQTALLVAVAPPQTKRAKIPQVSALVASSAEGNVIAATSQVVVLVGVKSGVADPARSSAWTFVLDGHQFYVLNLGGQGTFVYDQGTGQWAKFTSQGFDGQWNFINGTMWGDRIVGADILTDYVWEMNPLATVDEGWREIYHAVTGGLTLRSRVFKSCDAVRIASSIGQLDEVNGSVLLLSYSDDQEQTWVGPFAVDLIPDDFTGEIAYRSLGSFAAPGRIFLVEDMGGLLRIDGADAFIQGFDNDQQDQQEES